MYQLGKELFTGNGYTDIGMDHFALQDDELYKAWKEGSLHRNFMGYTTKRSGMLLGLGVSSISDVGIAFAQNEKALHDYYERIKSNELALAKGYFLDEEDVAFKNYILNMSCRGFTELDPKHVDILKEFSFPESERLEKDGLVEWNEHTVRATALGRNFIRNICKAFDLHLLRTKTKDQNTLFSKSI